MSDDISAADIKSSMDKLLAELSSIRGDLSTVKNDMITIKGDQSRLSVAVNRLQTDKFPSSGSGKGPVDGEAPASPPPLQLSAPLTHKLRFPKYDGVDDPLGWLHKCEQFFRKLRTLEDEKVLTASFYMDGAAEQWYYRLEQNHGVPTWPQFVDLVNKRFGPSVRSNTFGEVTHLRRTGTVREYEDQFLQLLARCEHVTERQQIDIFTVGLRNPLRIDVELQRPKSLEDAMGLARAFERRLEIEDDSPPPATRSSSRAAPPPRGSHPPPSATMRTPPPATSTLPPPTPPAPTKGARRQGHASSACPRRRWRAAVSKGYVSTARRSSRPATSSR